MKTGPYKLYNRKVQKNLPQVDKTDDGEFFPSKKYESNAVII